jgi:hypothetical protein
MIDALGRKLVAGDVLEFPNLKDYHPLDTNNLIPKALPRYYVIQDAAFAAEGFSPTWLPHLWRVKATPMVATQEFDDILNKPIDPDNPGAGTIEDFVSMKNKDQEINDAIVQQAEVEVPRSGYDNTAFYVTATVNDEPVKPGTPTVDGYLVGYMTGNNLPPNGLPVTPGVSFPSNPGNGDYALRLDYFPNRLFRFNGTRWVKVEDGVRTELTPGDTDNKTLKESFQGNRATIATTERGTIPSSQSLSDLLNPKKDN